MKKRKIALSLRTLLTAAFITALLSASAMYVNASPENASPAKGITVNETFTVENEISIGVGTRSSLKLYATANAATYDSSYGEELTDGSIAEQVYSGFYSNFVTTPGNSPFTVNLNPSIKVNGIDNGTVNEQGEKIIDIDTTDQAFDNLEKSINLGAIAFTYDHPEVFWIRNHSYNVSSADVIANDDGTWTVDIKAITVAADEAYPGAYSQRSTVNSGISAAQSAIQTGDTRYDTLKNIHDYICENAEYDYDAAAQAEASEAHTAAPLFNGNKKFVCEGYSKALKILCDKFGIPCALVRGEADVQSGSEAHMWAYVKMDDGNWYAVDVTWDDQDTRITDDFFLKGKSTMNVDHRPAPPLVNNEEVPIVYPEPASNDYDPNWNQGTTPTNPTGTSDSTSTDTTSTDTTSTDTTSTETTSTDATSTDATSTDATSTDATSTDTTSASTKTTQVQPKQITLRLDDPNNGFVKSAEIPETAKAKAGNDDVALTKIKVIVTKLDDTKKKSLSDGITKINNSFDPDNSILEAYDIELVDSNGHTVTITEGKIKICLAFPDAQTKKYTNYVYSVYHQKADGGMERVKPVKYNAQGVWFESDKFSPFVLVSFEKSGGDEPSPGTGETILMTVVAVILLALAAGAIAFVVIRNRASSDDEKTAASETHDSENADTPAEDTPNDSAQDENEPDKED